MINDVCTDNLEVSAETAISSGLTLQASNTTITGATKSEFSWTWTKSEGFLD